MTPKKVKRSRDGRCIAPRKKVSSGAGVKEQLWSVADLDLAFDLWQANKNKPPKEKLSKQSKWVILRTQAGKNSRGQLINSYFTDPKDAEQADDAEKDKPDEQPATPEVAEEVTVQAEVHKAEIDDYLLEEGVTGGAEEEVEEDKKDKEEDEEEEEEDNEEWDVIQEQVDAGKIRVKVQVGNHNKRVMQPQPYQAGRNFKPIFIVDVTPD